MQIKLYKQESKVIDPSIEGNDVFVDFDYDRINDYLLEISFETQIGQRSNKRAEMKFVYRLHLDDNEKNLENEELICNNMQNLTAEMMPLLSMLDEGMSGTYIESVVELEEKLDEEKNLCS